MPLTAGVRAIRLSPAWGFPLSPANPEGSGFDLIPKGVRFLTGKHALMGKIKKRNILSQGVKAVVQDPSLQIMDNDAPG